MILTMVSRTSGGGADVRMEETRFWMAASNAFVRVSRKFFKERSQLGHGFLTTFMSLGNVSKTRNYDGLTFNSSVLASPGLEYAPGVDLNPCGAPLATPLGMFLFPPIPFETAPTPR